MSKKRFAVVLSGTGVYDGSEIHEAVLTLLAIDRQSAEYNCFAPDIEQYHVINHLTGEESAGEHRNVLVESARIARGRSRWRSTAHTTRGWKRIHGPETICSTRRKRR